MKEWTSGDPAAERLEPQYIHDSVTDETTLLNQILRVLVEIRDTQERNGALATKMLGTAVRPGDTLIVSSAENLTQSDVADFRQAWRSWLPSVDVRFISGAAQMLAYHPDQSGG